jgi:PAS domain S-box-containing protein
MLVQTTKSTKSSEVVLFPQQPALRLIYDTAPIGLACLSLDCRYLQINQRLTEICGISVEDHLGRSVRECVPALADSVEAIVRSIMETGEPVVGIEVAGQRADQVEDRYWVTYWHPLHAPSGEIVAVNVAAEEITERKRAEGRLRVQHTVAQILAEAATIEEVTPRILRAIGECLGWDVGALWRVDREADALRCVELWHKASIEVPEFERVSRQFTFVRGVGLPGRVWSSLEPEYIPDVVPDENFPRGPSAQSEGIHAAFGFPILLGRDVLGVIEFFSREIRQPDQDLLNMLATIGSQIGQFIERKRAEREVRDARDAAETALRRLRETQDSLIEAEKLAALGRMVAGIAHEVNSPVGISLTVATSLQQKAAEFAAEAARGDLKRSSLNAFLDLVQVATAQLVNNLGRSAERIQSFKQAALDQGQAHRRDFDASELTEQVLSHLTRELKQHAIALNLHCEPGLVMDSYPGPFGQVLTHLVVNAMTHAFPDGLDGTIDIGITAAGPDRVELRVADNGCGMAPEIKRLAFDPFFTTRRHYGATGLGLHNVYNIVSEQLGGTLSLESEPGSGTTIQLILPRSAGPR